MSQFPWFALSCITHTDTHSGYSYGIWWAGSTWNMYYVDLIYTLKSCCRKQLLGFDFQKTNRPKQKCSLIKCQFFSSRKHTTNNHHNNKYITTYPREHLFSFWGDISTQGSNCQFKFSTFILFLYFYWHISNLK